MERLRTLWEVVRAGSIMAAADRDPNRQSLISRQIGELEGALGVELLDRAAKPHRVTAVAERLAQVHERFTRELEAAAGRKAGRPPVTIGAGQLVIRGLLIPWLGKERAWAGKYRWVFRNLTSRKIKEDLAAERLDLGVAAGLEERGPLRVKQLASHGMKLVLPEGRKPDKTGWARLAKVPVVVLEGDGRFRRFLAEAEAEHGVQLEVAAECTSHSQAVDLAEAAGWAVFVPEWWWQRSGKWHKRTQELPGLEEYRHALGIGWNARVVQRRNEIERLVKALAKQAHA